MTLSPAAIAQVQSPNSGEVFLTLASINWEKDVAAWIAGRTYAFLDYVKPTAGGAIFQAITAGTSSTTTEPTWPTPIDSEINDGSVVWKKAGPINIVNNTEDITSNGDIYSAFPFRVTYANLEKGVPARARLFVDNVDRRIVQAVREQKSSLGVSLSVIMASAPDNIEFGPCTYDLNNVEWDAAAVSGDLEKEDLLNTAFPGTTMTPEFYLALF